ncbi:MAG: ABC transporter permease [Peptococcaceae bacterium]|nr:ABC transporter permease [Peptococcaceae bacterium]
MLKSKRAVVAASGPFSSGSQNKVAAAGIIILSFFIIMAVFAPLVAPHDPFALDTPYLPPGKGHPLGTNDIGQDLLSELVYGARVSLFIGFLAAFLATSAGAAIGLFVGYLRGAWDELCMRLADLFFLIPALPLVIVLVAYLKPGIWNIIVAIAILGWASTARVVRARVLQVREMPFVKSAKALGAGGLYIVLQHLLPNTMEVILAKASLAIAGAMLTEAGISFLGLGDPTQKSWGMMLHYAFSHGGVINGYWWWYLPPALCISLAVLGFVLLSYAGREEKGGWGN